MKIELTSLVLICVLSTALLAGENLQNAWFWISIGIQINKDITVPMEIIEPNCAHIWISGAIVVKYGDPSDQRSVWKYAINCSENNISQLHIIFPNDLDMAQLATQRYPNNYGSWLWLGDATALINYLDARQAYLRSVALAPENGLVWCTMGWNYEQTNEIENAFRAFLNCCLNGDPGLNGCSGAGRMMEILGNTQQAIEYYQLSRWEGALKRANELKTQLNTHK